MYQKIFISLFRVRPQETWLVKRLFFIQFFLSLAGAFLFITANTVFISSLPISDLPKGYIYSGIFLLAANFGYRKLDIALDIKKLSFIVLGICVAMVLLLWGYVQLFDDQVMPMCCL